MGYFLGLNQWRSFRKHKESGSLPFHSDAILAHVRHPWYSGGVALLWGFGSCTDVYLLTRIILTTYIILGTILAPENQMLRNCVTCDGLNDAAKLTRELIRNEDVRKSLIQQTPAISLDTVKEYLAPTEESPVQSPKTN